MSYDAIPPHAHEPLPGSLAPSSLAGLVRFAKALRYHKGVIAGCLLASGLLAGLYYTTAERRYESLSQLLVTQQGGDVMQEGDGGQGHVRDEMPTYVEILVSDKVLSQAVARLDETGKVDFAEIPAAEWTERMRENLSVRVAGRTNLIDIAYLSADPRAAQAVVRAVLASFSDFMGDVQRNRSHELLQILSHEKADLEKKLADKEAELIRLKSESGALIGSGDQSVNVVMERIAKLNGSLVEAQREALEARATLDTVESAVRRGEDISQFVMEAMGDVARQMLLREMGLDVSDQWVVQQAAQQLLEAKSDLNAKLAHYGEAHPEIRRLRERIQTTETFLRDRRTATAEQIRQVRNTELGPRLLQIVRQRYQQAHDRESSLRAEFEREKGLALGLNNRMAKVEIANLDLKRMREFYHVLLDRIRSIDLNQNGGVRIAVVREPQVPIEAATPKLARTAILALMAGFVVGAALVYVMDTLDDRFRSPEELQAQVGVSMLAMLRRLPDSASGEVEPLPVVATPDAPEAEGFHMLRTVLGLSGEANRSLTITSSEQGDGKTTAAANLAAAYAQLGRRTIVIDGDMRRPGLTKLFGCRETKGLSQILRDTAPIDRSSRENIIPSGVEHLDLIPCGPRPINPADLLTSPRFSEFVNWAESEYDQVIIDAPPVMPVSDPLIIGHLTDGLLLIVRPDKNRRRVVIRTVETLRRFGVRLVGLAVNSVKAADRGDMYSYSYGYGDGYSDQDYPVPADHDRPARSTPCRNPTPATPPTPTPAGDDIAEDFDGRLFSPGRAA